MPVKPRSGQILLAITALAIIATSAGLIYKHTHPALFDDALSQQATTGPVNQMRPDFSLPDQQGKPRDISEWDGKVLVINFWASWCKPCLREIPDFIRLQDQYGKNGLQFIGIAIDEPESVSHFLEKLKQPVNYPMLIAENDAIEIAIQYGNDSGVLPYTVIVDRNNKIAYTQYGAFDHADAEQQIQKIMDLSKQPG